MLQAGLPRRLSMAPIRATAKVRPDTVQLVTVAAFVIFTFTRSALAADAQRVYTGVAQYQKDERAVYSGSGYGGFCDQTSYPVKFVLNGSTLQYIYHGVARTTPLGDDGTFRLEESALTRRVTVEGRVGGNSISGTVTTQGNSLSCFYSFSATLQ